MKFFKSIGQLKEEILGYDQLDLYRKYGQIEIQRLGKAVKSPLREDKHASFNCYQPAGSRKVYFKDFNDQRGDIFKFMEIMCGLNFKDAVLQIASDLGIDNTESIPTIEIAERKTRVHKMRKRVEFLYEELIWGERDFDWWKKYGITLTSLFDYNVIPIKWFSILDDDGKERFTATYSSSDPIFMYKYMDATKFYRPQHKGKIRFISNAFQKDVFGLEQLKKEVELNGKQRFVPILAGEKDVISFYANTGYYGICLASEGALLTPDLYLELLDYGDCMLVMYDNDFGGWKATLAIIEQYKTIIPIYLFRISQVNDTSDFFKGSGPDPLWDYINNKIFEYAQRR